MTDVAVFPETVSNPPPLFCDTLTRGCQNTSIRYVDRGGNIHPRDGLTFVFYFGMETNSLYLPLSCSLGFGYGWKLETLMTCHGQISLVSDSDEGGQLLLFLPFFVGSITSQSCISSSSI